MLVQFFTRNGNAVAVNPDAVAYVREVCFNGQRNTEIVLGYSDGKPVTATVDHPIETVINQLNDAAHVAKQ